MKTKIGPAISLYTLAFNAEKYIEECAESVLNQSFSDFEWIILNNGSTDRTGEILEEYAEKDGRIKLFHNNKNTILHNVPFDQDYVHYFENLTSEYWCSLDSDDFLHVDFLKDLYTAAKMQDADIAVGGTEMFKEDNVEMRGKRCPLDFYTTDMTSLADILPNIYGCFRPMWGKLIKVPIVIKHWKFREQYPLKLVNGGDTLFNLDCLKFSSSALGVDKVLYYYRIRNTSLYHSQVNESRYLDYKVIYDETKKLLYHWNKVNGARLDFIASVLYFSIKDCIEIAGNAVAVSLYNRMAAIEAICSDQEIYQIFKHSGLTSNLFVDTQKTVDKIMENLAEEELFYSIKYYIYRLFLSIKMITLPQSNRQNAFLLYLSSLTDEANKNRIGSDLFYNFLKLVDKNELAQLEKHGIKAEFLASDPDLICELVNYNFKNAIAICEQNMENPSYYLLKQALQEKLGSIHREPIVRAKELMEKHFSEGNVEEAVDFIINVLDHCPLDKEALCYKMQLLIMNGDILTALETAKVLEVFYSNDSVVKELITQLFEETIG